MVITGFASWTDTSIETEERKRRDFIDTMRQRYRAREREKEGRKKRGGRWRGEERGLLSPCIFGGTPLAVALPRDISTRPTIPTPKCTPDGRLHSCMKKKKSCLMLDDILTRHMARLISGIRGEE